MGDPATPTPAERTVVRELAAKIVESVRNDEPMPLDVQHWTSQIPDHIANALETRIFMLAQEIQLLRADVEYWSRSHHQLLNQDPEDY
jgi:5'-deoxynucleotidase YfbR-like HD superfamily hydrolase